MSKLRLAFCAALAALASTLHASAQQSYSALYAFGDSLTDTGNDWALSFQTVPAAPYWDGHFSNGPIWVEDLAANLGLAAQPVLTGGTNYAFGGALMLPSTTTPWWGSLPSVTEQVQVYLLLHGNTADPKALYVLEGGNNDVLQGATGNPAVLGAAIGTALYALGIQLSNAGARHIMIANVTDVGRMPAAATFATFATSTATYANQTLQGLLSLTWLTNPGTNFTVVDTFGLMDSLVDSPSVYGLSNATTPCMEAQLCSMPSEWLFWDDVHPTEAASTFLGNLALSELP